jgi:hypothetical protein
MVLLIEIDVICYMTPVSFKRTAIAVREMKSDPRFQRMIQREGGIRWGSHFSLVYSMVLPLTTPPCKHD